MTFEPTDFIDFDVMHAPPCFVTTVRTTAGKTVVVTDGADFAGLVVQWPDALEEERAEDFWALGLLHLTDVDAARAIRSASFPSASALSRGSGSTWMSSAPNSS